MPIANIDQVLALPTLPGMNKLESDIGKAWIAKHQQDYDSVEFDTHLGAGVQLPPGTPDYVIKSALASTTKRTDIIAHSRGSVTIVEAKEQVTLGAMGQLLGYRRLYLQAYPQTGHVDLVVAGLSIVADIAHIFAENSIAVELFPATVLST